MSRCTLQVGDWVRLDDEIALVLGWRVRLVDGVRHADPYVELASGERRVVPRAALELLAGVPLRRAS